MGCVTTKFTPLANGSFEEPYGFEGEGVQTDGWEGYGESFGRLYLGLDAPDGDYVIYSGSGDENFFLHQMNTFQLTYGQYYIDVFASARTIGLVSRLEIGYLDDQEKFVSVAGDDLAIPGSGEWVIQSLRADFTENYTRPFYGEDLWVKLSVIGEANAQESGFVLWDNVQVDMWNFNPYYIPLDTP